MRKILIFLFLMLSNLGYAQHRDNEKVSLKANQQKDQQLKVESFACYLTQRDEDIELLSRETDEGEFIQNVAVKNKIYRLQMISSKYEIKLGIYHKNSLIDRIRYKKEDLSFRKANVKIKSQIKKLNLIECFVGKKAFYYHYDDSRDFVIHNHVQKQYYGDSKELTDWYNRYAQAFDKMTNLVLMDGYSVGKKYKLDANQLEGNSEMKVKIVTGKVKNDLYKIAPTGNLHFSFSSHFNGDVYLLGTAYNYCFNNLFLSLGRALLSSPRGELKIHMPAFYVKYQVIGIKNSMDIMGMSGSMNLGSFIDSAPGKFEKLFKKQKRWIEKELDHQVEVILAYQQPETNKPVLKLNIVLP